MNDTLNVSILQEIITLRSKNNDTHLAEIERIEKLFTLVMVAFTWAYLVGDYLHKYINPIPIKKHGNKTKSLFKHGLTYIATVLLNAFFQDDIDI